MVVPDTAGSSCAWALPCCWRAAPTRLWMP